MVGNSVAKENRVGNYYDSVPPTTVPIDNFIKCFTSELSINVSNEKKSCFMENVNKNQVIVSNKTDANGCTRTQTFL